ncbi:hypothetical protein M758_UG040400 [Ceratodon purpureus]|nr:hypothetical protein M758_UG040400 [Ceratodon purpureus]
MEDSIARGAPDEARIWRRSAKLMQREIEYASAQGSNRIRCPYTIHVCERQSSLSITSYRRCVARNNRHLWFFGTSEVSSMHLQLKLALMYNFYCTDNFNKNCMCAITFNFTSQL